MRKWSAGCLWGVILFLCVGVQEAKALSLDFLLSSSSVDVGDTVTLSAVIGGLGDFTAPSLGAFDFNIEFDPALVELTASPVIFGTLLGDEGFGESLSGSSAASGSVNLFALSFLTGAELDALQPSSFTLATLSFNALASGVNAFSFSSVILGDGAGDPLVASLGGASLTINSITPPPPPPPPPPSDVPEPSSILLLGIGIAVGRLVNFPRAKNHTAQ